MPPNERKDICDPYGVHRVLDAEIKLPQAAEKLDNRLPLFSNEMLIEVEKLNIDAASFVQMEEETRGSKDKIAEIVMQNCRQKGKQQNRVTGSGGMLIGRVKEMGSEYSGPLNVKVGDPIATLVSLTLTPLHLETVQAVDLKTHQLTVKGYAILFPTGIFAHLPKDLDQSVAMAVYDVAGAPATVSALCQKNQTLVVLGAGGKAGTLCCVAGRKKVGSKGRVIAIEPRKEAAEELEKLKVCSDIVQVNAKDPIAVSRSIEKLTRGKMGDVVVNVASVPDTEMAALLSVAPKGKVLFFGMATSFSKVVLGAEGIAASASLFFGNGYIKNHSQIAIDLVRKNSSLKELFYRRYGANS